MHSIDQPLEQRLKARLYLNAVLPAFERLLEYSEEARGIVHNRNFSICFQTNNRLKSQLRFADGSCLFKKSKARESDIVLHFFTEEHLNNEFENQGFRVPIPLRGASKVGDIKAFKALAKILENYLRPSEEALLDPVFHLQHVTLQLDIALRATVELTNHEPRSNRIMTNTPNGIAYFAIGEDGFGAWLQWLDDKLTIGRGFPERKPDAMVTFLNPETALKAIGNKIDVMAAIGKGEIKVSGLIPLADALGYIFERIPLYIQP